MKNDIISKLTQKEREEIAVEELSKQRFEIVTTAASRAAAHMMQETNATSIDIDLKLSKDGRKFEVKSTYTLKEVK